MSSGLSGFRAPIVVALGLAVLPPVFPAPAQTTAELRGIYLELHDNPRYGAFPLAADGDWRKLFAGLRSLGINAIFPNVVTPAGAAYPSRVVPARPRDTLQNQEDLLAVLVEASHAESLEIHPWTIEWYNAPPGTDPDRLVRDPAGKSANTLCPSVAENRRQMQQMLLELAAGYDIDGLQYDYMRLPGAEYCYCRHCREGFEKKIGRPVAEWPAEVLSGGGLDSLYLDYLSGIISSFVEETYPMLKRVKPNLVVSAAVWCHDTQPRNMSVRQDWGKWVENGWLDFIAPMNYGNKWVTDHFEMYARNEARHVAGKMPLVFGLGAYLDSPEGQVAAVRFGRSLGGSGFILYTLTEKTYTEHLPALSREVWASPARVPAFGRNRK